MEITPKIRKLIYGMFDTMIEGADKYVTNSSMWLIFTEEKRWVIEFTKTKTLWFNYNLFHSELKLLSIDCVESKDIIKEWFESRFLGIDVVDETLSTAGIPLYVEDTIQIGVMEINTYGVRAPMLVEKITQIGVKHTRLHFQHDNKTVEDTIKNGVKHTEEWVFPRSSRDIKMAIEFGGQQPPNVEKIITGSYPAQFVIEDIIQSGVKDTGARHLRINRKVDDVIENGVKVIMSGSEWYHQDEVDNLVKNGVK